MSFPIHAHTATAARARMLAREVELRPGMARVELIRTAKQSGMSLNEARHALDYAEGIGWITKTVIQPITDRPGASAIYYQPATDRKEDQ